MSYGYVTPDGGFTIEFWFKHSTGTGTSEALVNQQTANAAASWSTSPDTNGRQFLIYLAIGGEMRIDWHTESGSTYTQWFDPTPGTYATDGEWHFFALRMAADKRTYTCWVDGDVKPVTVLAFALDWKPGVMSFGGAYAAHLGNFGAFLFDGGLAYFAVWDTALTDSRIMEHYTAGSGGTVFYGDTEVQRLQRLYSYAAVPMNAQRFDSAVTTLQGVQVAGQNGLEKILGTASDAGGVVFADGQSTMVYQNRAHRYNRPILATLTESASSSPDVGMEFATDDTKVYNDIRATRPFGGSARIRNRASEYEYGPKILELTRAITSDDELRNAATWIAERYGEDRVRISGVTMSAESSDVIQKLVGTITIGDRIAFDDMPDNAPQSRMEFIVEAISVQANFKDQTWTLGLELSPAELWKVFQVGVTTLGDGSRVAF